MRPFFLKFSDEAEARLVGETWLQLRKDGSYVEDVATPEWSYHVVGLLYTKPVMVDGVITVPSVQKPGFHVNVLTEALPEGLLPCVVEPVTPECVFGGWQDWAPPKELV